MVQIFEKAKAAINAVSDTHKAALFAGNCEVLLSEVPENSLDLTVSSPPYCIGKVYEEEKFVDDFMRSHRKILPKLVKATKWGGSICWQVGYHISDKTVFPLDYAVFEILRDFPEVKLRNRIAWTFGHGLHGSKRFSGRHETILWFTKGAEYSFDLDSVRVPQKYPGKRHYRGEKRGELSCNPKGKNPGDVWDIPNVKANHIEKTSHPCQFPIAVAQRFVRALCPLDGLVFDPFMGSASTGAAALLENRRFLGSEINRDYLEIAAKRLASAALGTLAYRSASKPMTGHLSRAVHVTQMAGKPRAQASA